MKIKSMHGATWLRRLHCAFGTGIRASKENNPWVSFVAIRPKYRSLHAAGNRVFCPLPLAKWRAASPNHWYAPINEIKSNTAETVTDCNAGAGHCVKQLSFEY